MLQGQGSTLQWLAGPSREHLPEPGRIEAHGRPHRSNYPVSGALPTTHLVSRSSLSPLLLGLPEKPTVEAHPGQSSWDQLLGEEGVRKRMGEGDFPGSPVVKNLLCHAGGLPRGSDGKESACNVGDLGSIPGWGRSPGEGNGIPLQYSCLENSMDRRA